MEGDPCPMPHADGWASPNPETGEAGLGILTGLKGLTLVLGLAEATLEFR